MLPPTSICTNPNQPPPAHFSIHAQQFQPQTGSVPPGSTPQYMRTFSNGGGGGSGPGSTDANVSHINGFHPPHQQLRNYQPQQQPTAPNAINPGIGQQPFGHVFMLAQAFPNAAAPPPGHFDAMPPLGDRQFQQPSIPPLQHTSTAPPLMHQHLIQQIMPPTSICTNPYQPPPQHFPIHAQQYQPQTGAVPPGSTGQYIRPFSNGGGSGGQGGTDANGAHINGFHPTIHQHLRSFQPQQQQAVPTAVNPGLGQQPFGHHQFFMLPQTFPNATAPPPGHFDAMSSLVDRQFQQQPSMPSLQHTSTASSLMHQQLIQQPNMPHVPPPQLNQQPPPQSAPPHHQSPQFQQQACLKGKRPCSIQAPGSTEATAGEQPRDGNQSGRQSAVFSNPSPRLQRLTPPTPTSDAKLIETTENDTVKTEEINVGDDYSKRPQNRHPSFSNKNGGSTISRGSFYKYNQQPPNYKHQSQDVRTHMQNTNTPVICPECGNTGHIWNYCPRIKRERDESIAFAEIFEQRAFHPALKTSVDGNTIVVSQNNYRKSDNHQQQNFRGAGFNKNFGPRNDFPRHQRYSSSGVGGGNFISSGGKPMVSGSGYTPSVRSSGVSDGDGPGSVSRQGGFASGGGGNRKDHQKPHNIYWNKNWNKNMHQNT